MDEDDRDEESAAVYLPEEADDDVEAVQQVAEQSNDGDAEDRYILRSRTRVRHCLPECDCERSRGRKCECERRGNGLCGLECKCDRSKCRTTAKDYDDDE